MGPVGQPGQAIVQRTVGQLGIFFFQQRLAALQLIEQGVEVISQHPQLGQPRRRHTLAHGMLVARCARHPGQGLQRRHDSAPHAPRQRHADCATAVHNSSTATPDSRKFSMPCLSPCSATCPTATLPNKMGGTACWLPTSRASVAPQRARGPAALRCHCANTLPCACPPALAGKHARQGLLDVLGVPEDQRCLDRVGHGARRQLQVAANVCAQREQTGQQQQQQQTGCAAPHPAAHSNATAHHAGRWCGSRRQGEQ